MNTVTTDIRRIAKEVTCHGLSETLNSISVTYCGYRRHSGISCHSAVQGHSRSPILVPIERPYATSY